MNKVKLSSIIDIISGGTPKTDVSEYWEGGNIGWLSVTDFNNDLKYVYSTEKKITESGLKNSNTKLLQKGDIIISARGTVGALAQIGTPMCFNQSCFGLRGKKDIADSDFLYYCLRNYVHNIKKRSQGSVFDTINLNSFELMEIEIPKKITTQKQIASVLSSLDSKVELNNRINAELEAMAKTLYDYWFVQFDFPNAEGKPYKSSGGNMVWCKELKREIPEGWEVKELGSEIEIQRGISYTSNEINGDGVPMISLNSFNLDGTYKSNGIKSYSGKYSGKNTLKPGDLLIAATDVTRNADIIGRSILVPDYYNEDLVFSMDIAKIIPFKVSCSFLMFLFNSDHYHNYIKWFASGTIVLHLNLDGLKTYNTEFPPYYLLEKFDKFYLPIANRIYMTAKENQQLSSLRDWLLPMLMNGQVKVSSATLTNPSVEEKMMMAAEPVMGYGK